MDALNPTPETTAPLQGARIWKDGERMTPNLNNEYWEKVREYWRGQPPGAVFEKILEFQNATPKGREQYRSLGQRTPSITQEVENKAGDKLIDSSFLSKLKPLIAGSEAAPFLDEE